MNVARSIAKNAAVLFIAEAISYVISFAIIVIIARYLGDSGLGKYSFVFAFAGIISIVSDIGFSSLAIRDISKNPSLTEKYYSNIAAIKLILGIFSVLITVIAGFFVSGGREVIYSTFLASAAMFFINYNKLFISLFRSYDVMEYESVARVAERIIALGLVFFVLMRGLGLFYLVLAFVASNFIGTAVCLFFTSKKITKFRLSFDFKFWKYLISNSFPFWLTGIFLTLYFKIDTVMLSFIKDYSSVGIYNAAYKIIDTLSRIPFILVGVLFPIMSMSLSKSEAVLKNLYKKAFYYLSIIAIPIAVGITILSPRIIMFVYKNDFSESSVPLQILVWALALMFVNYTMGNLLNTINKQKLFTLSAGICALFNITLNIILIPPYNYKGAAFATVLTEIINFSILYFFVSRSGYSINILKSILRPLAAGSLMAIFLIYFGSYHLLIVIPLGALVYFASFLLIGGLSKEDYGIFKGVFKR